MIGSWEQILLRMDANNLVGYGHLYRCLQILSILCRSGREGIQISVKGEISDSAVQVLSDSFEGKVAWRLLQDGLDSKKYDLCLIDTMFDTFDMDFYDIEDLLGCSGCSDTTVLVSSSMDIPNTLPVDYVFGYMLSDRVEPENYVLRRDLSYAPISESLFTYREGQEATSETIENIFISMGGWHDLQPVMQVLYGLKSCGFSGKCTVLLSQDHKNSIESVYEMMQPLQMEFISGVPDVFQYLSQGDLVICSYGNLMFESVALGIPSAVVGLKEFQKNYALHLEKKGIIYFLGEVEAISDKCIQSMLGAMSYSTRQKYSLQNQKIFQKPGIQLIADEIVEILNKKSLRV